MQKNITLIILFGLFISCSNKEHTPTEIVTQYFEAFDTGDFESVKTTISDSITIIEGPFVMPFSRKSFHGHFKWDSVFKPNYEILELKEENNAVIATISQENLRNAFLENNPLKSQHTIHFKNGKISKIELIDYKDADFTIWQNKRDSLIAWIKNNHPELDGFVNDLTMKGAQEYLRAIELYKSR